MLLEDALGQTRGAAGVHENDGVVLVGLGGQRRRGRGEHVFVGGVVPHVAFADQHDAAERVVSAHLLARGFHERGEGGVGEDHPALGVGEDVGELLRREAQVQRVDDARAEEGRVPELEVGGAVQGEDGEAVGGRDAQLAGQGVAEPPHPFVVLAPAAPDGAVDDALAACVEVDRGVVELAEDEFLHADGSLGLARRKGRLQTTPNRSRETA